MMYPSYINNSHELEIQRRQNLTISSQCVKREHAPYWDKEFINTSIDQCQNPSHRMLLTFLWESGVRITEAINLQKKDIDFSNYVMTVKWLKSRKYHNRVVPLHPDLREKLLIYTASMLSEDKIFPISRQRAWQITKKELGGHPHMMRHSFAVNWLRCDGDLVILKGILGHSKIQTTMEYLKIVPMDQGKELLKIQFR